MIHFNFFSFFHLIPLIIASFALVHKLGNLTYLWKNQIRNACGILEGPRKLYSPIFKGIKWETKTTEEFWKWKWTIKKLFGNTLKWIEGQNEEVLIFLWTKIWINPTTFYYICCSLYNFFKIRNEIKC